MLYPGVTALHCIIFRLYPGVTAWPGPAGLVTPDCADTDRAIATTVTVSLAVTQSLPVTPNYHGVLTPYFAIRVSGGAGLGRRCRSAGLGRRCRSA